jgi:radical SAM enzyme (TIGR01210 family)
MSTDAGSIRATNIPPWPTFHDEQILALRPPKPAVDPWRPHGWLVEQERTPDGRIIDSATIFLANRECQFRCLMCDLWKYTTDERVPPGAIPAQIEQALAESPRVQQVKLYNAGNFFDAQAIPTLDLPRVAELVGRFERVIVECHPRLIGRRCLEFRESLGTKLEIAMGLETVHPEVLPRLNKQMTLDDFAKAAQHLTAHGIQVRAFILLRPPFLSEEEGVEWAMASLDYAFDHGTTTAVVIPTRAGNGAMDLLAEQGMFQPPRLRSLEKVVGWGIAQQRGLVFADLWDARALVHCRRCGPARLARLERMNLGQVVPPSVACDCEVGDAS